VSKMFLTNPKQLGQTQRNIFQVSILSKETRPLKEPEKEKKEKNKKGNMHFYRMYRVG
jgi:hypothetical protein